MDEVVIMVGIGVMGLGEVEGSQVGVIERNYLTGIHERLQEVKDSQEEIV